MERQPLQGDTIADAGGVPTYSPTIIGGQCHAGFAELIPGLRDFGVPISVNDARIYEQLRLVSQDHGSDRPRQEINRLVCIILPRLLPAQDCVRYRPAAIISSIGLYEGLVVIDA